MTERVHPTQGEASSQLTSGAIKWAAIADWVVPSGTDYLAEFAGLSGTPLNGFSESHGGSSLDLTVDTGEAFIGGRWMAKDTQTTVTLAASTNNQTVYGGWESSTGNSVVIGLDSAFSSSDDGRRTPLYECDTDGSGITNVDTLYENEPIVPEAQNADTLDGIQGSAFLQAAVNEVVTGLWEFDDTLTINGQSGGAALQVNGGNITDADTVVIDGDADSGQDDDLLKVRSVANPDTDTFANSDTVLVTKGDGRVGVNTYSPSSALDVQGESDFRQDVDMHISGINNVGLAEILDAESNGTGARFGTGTDGRFFIAPVFEDSPRFNEELTYDHSNNRWIVESNSFRATDSGRATNRDDVTTGRDEVRRADVNIPNSRIPAGEHVDCNIALSSSDQANVYRISIKDGGSNDPPSGASVIIEGEGGGQSQSFSSALSGQELDTPLHTVDGPGAVRVRLDNATGSEQELNCHVVMKVLPT